MYAVSKQFNRFFTTSEYALSLIHNYKEKNKTNYLINTGIINYLWQAWNNFWKHFWLVYLLGGYDLKNNSVNSIPSLVGKSEKEAIHYLLFLLGKRQNPIGRISGSYQEPTWGDTTTITNICTSNLPPNSDIAYISQCVLNAISVLGDTPKHFQKVRNCSIHLDTDTIEIVKNSVQPRYRISKIKYPTDILFSKEIYTDKIAIQHWVDELIAVIKIIYI